MINEFITDVCDILEIPEPTVSYDTSHFLTDTMMAQCDMDDDSTIFIRKRFNPTPDYFFFIAHELRHIWQMQTDKDFFLSGYKPVDLCVSIEEYNLQRAEIDANAFGVRVMADFFQLKPLFEGLSDNVRKKNYEHADYFKDVPMPCTIYS